MLLRFRCVELSQKLRYLIAQGRGLHLSVFARGFGPFSLVAKADHVAKLFRAVPDSLET